MTLKIDRANLYHLTSIRESLRNSNKTIIFVHLIIFLLLTYPVEAQDLIERPVFSTERGFYSEPFDLLIFSKPSGLTIYYTLDGTDPRTSITAISESAPVQIHIDPEITTGRDGAPGIVIRACASQGDSLFSLVATYTFLFLNKIKTLSPDGVQPGPQWPLPNNSDYSFQFIDYGMDPDVMNDIRYQNKIEAALLAIPTISIVTDLNNLFDPDSGIYVNAYERGKEWERKASIELLNPDGSPGFQIDAGIRIRGGWFRHPMNPKHAFRLFFREEYGFDKLRFAMFGAEGTDEFDKLDLRTSHNFSWSSMGDPLNTMNRDVFSRDTQREMRQPYTRSRYYHLYINGTYWGLYQSQERSEARFAATYFGGSRDDYDVIKISVPPEAYYEIDATDGNLLTWQELWQACQVGFSTNASYFKIQGLNPDGTRNPEYKVLLDIDNLIDYMLLIFHTGNLDAPTDLSGTRPNNFYAIYNRNEPDGFKFFAHDNEWTMLFLNNRSGLYYNKVDDNPTVTNSKGLHPHYIHRKLTANPEYRMRVADRVYKHFFNHGALTPATCTARFLARANEIDLAIIAESARWGDAKEEKPFTKDDHWLPAINDIVNNWFPNRTNIVLGQLKSANLYPTFNPPLFLNNDIEIQEEYLETSTGFSLVVVNPDTSKGDIYYTLDGSDPRQIGGQVSEQAMYGADRDTVIISTTTAIKARTKYGSNWSALHQITLAVPNQNWHNLKFTEIHYNPLDEGTVSGREYEFIELKNIGSQPLNLTQVAFGDGILYTFPTGTVLNAGEFIVLASNSTEFARRYGFAPFAAYVGQLDNAGEQVAIITASGDTIISFKYDNQSPWPEQADGSGYSLVPKNPDQLDDPGNPDNWRASYRIHGSPGVDDVVMGIVTVSDPLPDRYTLHQNFPNPFNSKTMISFSIPAKMQVQIAVYDITGKNVMVLTNDVFEAGSYHVSLNANNLSSGSYFYKMTAGEFTSVQKLVVLK